MELIEDVVGVIVSFLGYKASLLDKKYRDQYFKEHGIWIHIYQIQNGIVKNIPEKFYEYKINLDIKDMYYCCFPYENVTAILSGYPLLLKSIDNGIETVKGSGYCNMKGFKKITRTKKIAVSIWEYPESIIKNNIKDLIFNLEFLPLFDQMQTEARFEKKIEGFR